MGSGIYPRSIFHGLGSARRKPRIVNCVQAHQAVSLQDSRSAALLGFRDPHFLCLFWSLLESTVLCQSFKAHNFKVRVSNPRSMVCLDLEISFKSSKPQSLSPCFPVECLKTASVPDSRSQNSRRKNPRSHTSWCKNPRVEKFGLPCVLGESRPLEDASRRRAEPPGISRCPRADQACPTRHPPRS